MAFQFAQAAVEIETARLLTYNAARLKEEGLPFAKEAAMAKYWASLIAQKVSGSAIEWAGGVGFTRETGIEKFWRDSKIVSPSVTRRVLQLTSHYRELSTREHLTFSCRPLLNSFRRSTLNQGTRVRGNEARVRVYVKTLNNL
jgi:hypothetical protein